jgi:putative flippase GtrA
MTDVSVPGRLAPHGATARQLASFGAIGVVSTLAYVVLYVWLREVTPAGAANALALVLTAVGNTAANRRLTFGVRGREGLARHHAAGLLAFAAALAITSASLLVLSVVAPDHGRSTELAILVLANALATVVRFLFLRSAVVARSPSGAGSRPATDRASGPRTPAAPTLATLSQSKRT